MTHIPHIWRDILNLIWITCPRCPKEQPDGFGWWLSRNIRDITCWSIVAYGDVRKSTSNYFRQCSHEAQLWRGFTNNQSIIPRYDECTTHINIRFMYVLMIFNFLFEIDISLWMAYSQIWYPRQTKMRSLNVTKYNMRSSLQVTCRGWKFPYQSQIPLHWRRVTSGISLKAQLNTWACTKDFLYNDLPVLKRPTILLVS